MIIYVIFIYIYVHYLFYMHSYIHVHIYVYSHLSKEEGEHLKFIQSKRQNSTETTKKETMRKNFLVFVLI